MLLEQMVKTELMELTGQMDKTDQLAPQVPQVLLEQMDGTELQDPQVYRSRWSRRS